MNYYDAENNQVETNNLKLVNGNNNSILRRRSVRFGTEKYDFEKYHKLKHIIQKRPFKFLVHTFLLNSLIVESI